MCRRRSKLIKTSGSLHFYGGRVTGTKVDTKTLRRYERVKAVQKTGETTRNMWHQADWEKVGENPNSIAFPREDWIHLHDAETHAETMFDEIFKKYSDE